MGRWGKTHPRAWKAKPLVESPETCQTEPGRTLHRGPGHGAAPTGRFTRTRRALAPTVPRRGTEGKPPQARESPNVLALASRPSLSPQLIRVSALQGSPGSGLCAILCTPPSPRRHFSFHRAWGLALWPGAFAAPAGAGQCIHSPDGRAAQHAPPPRLSAGEQVGGKAAAGRGSPCLPTTLRLSCPP